MEYIKKVEWKCRWKSREKLVNESTDKNKWENNEKSRTRNWIKKLMKIECESRKRN